MIKRRLTPYYLKKTGLAIAVGAFRYTLLASLAFMILYPLLFMISNAFFHPYDLGSAASMWIPPVVTFNNIIVSYIILNYPVALAYTALCTAAVTLLQMLSSALAGYAFARMPFKGRSLLFVLVILSIIVPPASYMLPQYVLFQQLHLLQKPASLFLLAALGQGLSGGLFIYIFRQFFRGLPKELEEAAYVDGASVPRTFLGIVLPTAKPAFVTVGVLSFVWNWNDTTMPQLFNSTQNLLRVKLSSLASPTGGGGFSSVYQAINNAFSHSL
ncbi:MAG: carbohydrate ABC transporter permease, partial [Clostridiales bacterium]|nr:carbohydrate ABC transporter permease [Clostridiales bacterium]